MAKEYKVVVRNNTDIRTDTGVGEVTTDNYDSSTYLQTIDTWMFAVSPDSNYQAAQTMYLGNNGFGNARALIRFTFKDVFAFMHGDISREISSNLYLYVDSSAGTTYPVCDCYMLDPDRRFIENQATWNICYTGNAWDSGGASSTPEDYRTTDAGSGTLQPAGSTATIDVSDSVGEWINNYRGIWAYVTGWVLKYNSEASGDYKQVGSSENITLTKRPVLSVGFKIRNGRKLGMWNAQNKSMGSSRGDW